MKFHATDNFLVKSLILPQSTSATELTDAYIDTKDYTEALVIYHAGTMGASAESDFGIEHSVSTTEASFGRLTGASFTQVTTANDDLLYTMNIDLTQTKRYIRGQNVGDGSNAGLVSGCVVLIGGKNLPVSQDQTVISVR